MRILFTVPHYYKRSSDPKYGSEAVSSKSRAAIVAKCLTAIHQTLGHHQRLRTWFREQLGWNLANRAIHAKVDVVLCTAGQDHLVEFLSHLPFRHHPTNTDPRFLGYECHRILADALGEYDFYAYLEDDLVILDAMFFQKLTWFAEKFGQRVLLQPNRYFISDNSWKSYIETIRSPQSIQHKGEDLIGRVMGTSFRFRRARNPHSGCFFLTQDQMKQWSQRPYFMDRSSAWIGPLESAATLGIARTFAVYKPDEQNASFLELLDGGWEHRPQSSASN